MCVDFLDDDEGDEKAPDELQPRDKFYVFDKPLPIKCISLGELSKHCQLLDKRIPVLKAEVALTCATIEYDEYKEKLSAKYRNALFR